MLYTVALPQWLEEDGERVQRWRKEYDPRADLLAPHVTLVFGADVDAAACLVQVLTVGRHTAAFDVAWACAAPVPTGPGKVHVYLLPEQGTAALVRLHRVLHEGPLAACRSTEHPFIPHVTLGVLPTFDQAARVADRWNASQRVLRARIDSLAVGRVKRSGFDILGQATLKA